MAATIDDKEYNILMVDGTIASNSFAQLANKGSSMHASYKSYKSTKPNYKVSSEKLKVLKIKSLAEINNNNK